MLRKLYRGIKRVVRIQPECRMAHFFSQEGEDVLLERIFEGKRDGFFVDVGAHHPMRFSNTYNSYLRGWRGINIDPKPGMAADFARLRPGDINLEIGIGLIAGELEYFIFNEGALNTFDPALAAQRDGVGSYHIVERRKMPVKPLAEVLQAHVPSAQKIDLLTIDVEGLDLEVLKSNDWEKFRPRIILAEDTAATSMRQALDSPLTQYLSSQGYELFAKTFCTMFFRPQPRHA